MKIYDKITDFVGNLIKNAHTNRPKDDDKPTIVPNKGYVDEFDTLRDSSFICPDEAAEGKVLGVSTTDVHGLPIGSQVEGMKSRDILEKILYGFKNNSQSRYIAPKIVSFERIDAAGDKAIGIEDTIQVKFVIDNGSCPGITDIYYTAGAKEPIHPYSNAIPQSGDELTIQIQPRSTKDDILLVVEFTPIIRPINDVYGTPIEIPANLDANKVQAVECSALISIDCHLPILVKQGDLGTLNPDTYDQNTINSMVKTCGFQYGIDKNWTLIKKHAKIPFEMVHGTDVQEVLIFIPFETGGQPHFTLSINDSTDISSALTEVNKSETLVLFAGSNPSTQNYNAYKFVSGAIPFDRDQLIFVGRYKNE